MKKTVLSIAYLGCLSFALFLNSCENEPVVPNSTGGNNVDTTWTTPNDTLGGGGTTNPNDTLGGGGTTNPNDTLGGGN